MGGRHLAPLLGLALLAGGPCFGAETPSLVIQAGSGAPVTITADELGQLPKVTVTPGFDPGHGPQQAVFEGPLLWTILEHAHAVQAGKPGEQVRQVVVLTGSDGYTAVLGLGEVSPDFEGKQVILADQMDGKPLGMAHLRAVVAGDHKAGRSVRDVVRIELDPARPR